MPRWLYPSAIQLTLLVDGCSDGSVVWFRIVFIYVTNVLHFGIFVTILCRGLYLERALITPFLLYVLVVPFSSYLPSPLLLLLVTFLHFTPDYDMISFTLCLHYRRTGLRVSLACTFIFLFTRQPLSKYLPKSETKLTTYLKVMRVFFFFFTNLLE